MNDKIKGTLAITAGFSWIIFILNFDRFMNQDANFGFHSMVACIIGLISIINGIRIYRRR